MLAKHLLAFLCVAAPGTLFAQNNNSATPTPPPARITMVVPKFEILASNVNFNLADQMKQVLVSNLVNEGTYNVVVSPYDLLTFRNDPVLAYGSEQVIKKANYILLGKIISYEEKDNVIGFGAYKANMGKTLRYNLSFEVINAKTYELVVIKNLEVKAKSGNVGVTTKDTNTTGNMTVNADISSACEKSLKDLIKFLSDQKSKIVLN